MSGLGGFTPPSSDTEIPENVLRRVQKLLAMANDARGNENEAANAAAMAQGIVAQYNIEIAQLEAMTQKKTDTRVKTEHQRAAMYSYQRSLMAGIARTHFCRYMVVDTHADSFGKMRKVKRHVLLGRGINVQACQMLYDYLIDTMDRLLPWQGIEKRGKNALLWLEGCATRLGERLVEKREQMEEESKHSRREDEMRSRHPSAASTGNALVLVDVYASEDDLNEDYLRGYEPGTTARNRAESKARYAAARAEHDAKILRFKEQGYTDHEAYMLAVGYSVEQMRERQAREKADEARQARAATRVARPETEAQRRDRERRERAQEDRYYRDRAKHQAKYGSQAYQAGRNTAENIGLDKQVQEQTKVKLS